jgi:hypothetical protein
MLKEMIFIILLMALGYSCNNSEARQFKQEHPELNYPFCKAYNPRLTVSSSIAPPPGFTRVSVTPGSFAEWLRGLPLMTKGSPVYLYNGKLKSNQNIHFAVVNIDVGTKDLQQCADAVIRLRAEYLYSKKDYDHLHFNFTNGFNAEFKKWAEGYRINVKGNNISWVKGAAPSKAYPVFREYLNNVFNYAGTSSLSQELKSVGNIKEMQIGDVFILGGFPGHAVLVTDMCENKATGEKLFIIQQSYMPAQEMHILKNLFNQAISPWYSLEFKGDLYTPEWTFKKEQLMRF